MRYREKVKEKHAKLVNGTKAIGREIATKKLHKRPKSIS